MNLNEWVTHGMVHACHVGDTWHDACMPCGGVQPIKRGLVKENRWRKRRKREIKRERKEDPTTFYSDFRRSEFVGPRVKVLLLDKGYALRGRNSSYFCLFPL